MTTGLATDAGSQPLRVLIVGLGSIGQRHARNLRALLGNTLELLAFRSRQSSFLVTEQLAADRARTPEQEYGIESFSSLDDALARRPHAAFICNPTSLHVEVALHCAAAGCDLFIEKPVSHDVVGVDDLLHLVEQRGLSAAVGCQLRFHPCLRRLHAEVSSGALGRPLSVRAEVGEYLPGWHPFEDYREGYAARRALGGGVILTLIHDIDYLVWLFGAPRRVFAAGGHLSALEVDVEDVASLLMVCESATGPLPVHLQMDYVRRPPRRTCAVLGGDGSAELDLQHNRLVIANATGEVRDILDSRSFERNELFMEELRNFLAARRNRTAPAVGLRDGILALRVALAARESLTTGHAVDIQ